MWFCGARDRETESEVSERHDGRAVSERNGRAETSVRSERDTRARQHVRSLTGAQASLPATARSDVKRWDPQSFFASKRRSCRQGCLRSSRLLELLPYYDQ